MIAVWLVGPPSVVASATTSDGSRPAVSAGARSSASSTDGTVGQRNARLRQPAEFGDDPVADVAQIGDALGHQTAELSEEVDELVDGGHHGAHGGGAAVDELLGGTEPGPVLRQRGRRGQHLGRRTGRVCRAVAQPVGDGLGCRGEAGRLRRAIRLVDIGRRLHVIEDREAAGPDHRAVLNAGNDGHTVQNVPPAVGGLASEGVTWAAMRRSCEADYKPTVDKSTQSGVKQQISTLIRAYYHTNGAPCMPKSVSKRSPRW